MRGALEVAVDQSGVLGSGPFDNPLPQAIVCTHMKCVPARCAFAPQNDGEKSLARIVR